MKIVKILSELRKRNIGITNAHCILAIENLGGSATKAELLAELGYTKKESLNLPRLCQQGILTSYSTDETPLEGGPHYHAYSLSEEGTRTLEILKNIINGA